MVKSCIGDKNKFAIEYDFIDDEQYTEISWKRCVKAQRFFARALSSKTLSLLSTTQKLYNRLIQPLIQLIQLFNCN